MATQLTISGLSHILNQIDPPVLGGSDETRQVTNKSSRGKKGRDGGWKMVDWVRVLISNQGTNYIIKGPGFFDTFPVFLTKVLLLNTLLMMKILTFETI